MALTDQCPSCGAPLTQLPCQYCGGVWRNHLVEQLAKRIYDEAERWDDPTQRPNAHRDGCQCRHCVEMRAVLTAGKWLWPA